MPKVAVLQIGCALVGSDLWLKGVNSAPLSIAVPRELRSKLDGRFGGLMGASSQGFEPDPDCVAL
uniref:Amino acid adenylation domain protein n=2 Tax=Aurantimonas manganoxydans TaxID=651183 RepID=A0A0P0Z4X6_9HYPH|nr:amino acid adenylation domain protein [Aurantimonas manganoxydans SI85-9A1]